MNIEDVFFCYSGSTEELVKKRVDEKASLRVREGKRGCGRNTYCEASRSVSSHGPAPTTVQSRSLLHENTNDTPTTECFRVYLTLDFKSVKREKYDFSNTSQTI